MDITIITTENRRLYPAIVYDIADEQHSNPIIDINDIYDLLYKDQNILVNSNQYDQYGDKLKVFDGKLEKSDIKAIFASKKESDIKDLTSIMTLSEAAEKWGLSNGSTIRKAIERNKFEPNEIKQAGSVWIITYAAMERVFGSIKNEESAYVLYDDFNLTKEYWIYAESIYSKCERIYDFKSKDNEVMYTYVKKILIKGLESLRNHQKVIIKTNWNNKIIQVINNEEDYYLYIELYYAKRVLTPEVIKRLLNELRSY